MEDRIPSINLKITISVVLFIIILLSNITNLEHPQNPGICIYVYDQSIKRFHIISINLKILESVHTHTCARAHAHTHIHIKGKGLDWPRGFQEVKVPRFHDNSTGWW